ncbi:MAG: LysR family transcriptional regulator [Pelagimonas sp.]|jgi:LysR family glycine cleavage system transcriptional activator|nr:LysR family transcriptional regulator [Pelagimonas sp.]
MNDHGRKLPPLEWVRAFEAAGRLGSFTAAAHEIGLTQSAVSQRVSQLENLLGCKLFERRARSVALTVQGETWFPQVSEAFDRLQSGSAALFGQDRPRITITASSSVIDLWIVPRLHRLQSLTGAEIQLQSMVVGALDAPSDRRVHIRYGAGHWPHRYKQRLYPEELAPVVAPDLLQTYGNLADIPRIFCSGKRPGWSELSDVFGAEATHPPALRFDTFGHALSAAREGLGVLLASLPLVQRDLDAGCLVQLGSATHVHAESYWMLADHAALSPKLWQTLVETLARQFLPTRCPNTVAPTPSR